MESAIVHITRTDGKLASVNVVIPIWISSQDNNNHFDIKIPLLHLETFVDNLEETDIAIDEVVTNFILLAEKHGGGLENQLELMGWKMEGSTVLNLDSVGTPFEGIMETGTEKSLHINLLAA